MEQLSSLDGVFLAVEDRFNQMNIGTVAIFEGAVPSSDEVRLFLAGRIALVPRCRQRVREPAGVIGRPVWIDDVGFDLDEHVHATSLIDGGGGDLESLVAELIVTPLDRSRPLWEVWVVGGLRRDRWALVAKVHHCMVDGIAGSDLLGAILARQPDAWAPVPDRWVATPEPSTPAFAWFSIRSAFGSLLAHLRGAADVLGHPRRSRIAPGTSSLRPSGSGTDNVTTRRRSPAGSGRIAAGPPSPSRSVTSARSGRRSTAR